MKKLLLSLLSITSFAFALNAQNVTIPDTNFKAYLVGNAAINTNADTEIQISEATSFTGTINCPSSSISDLTGVEQFTSLTKLYCYNNFNIASINVSNIITLQHLFCSSNALTQLDVSANVNLTFLACDDNDLISLNVANGNNSAITAFYANNNPNLTCIQVDNAATSTASWTNIDATASFSENCSIGIKNPLTKKEILAYPNPTSALLSIKTDEKIKEISIYNSLGALVQTEKTNTFTVEQLASGLYILNLTTEKGNSAIRFIKE